MKLSIRLLTLLFYLISIPFFISCSSTKKASLEEDFKFIFDGKSLSGWVGDSIYWKVENGNLVGEVTPSTILDRNSFIIWHFTGPVCFIK